MLEAGVNVSSGPALERTLASTAPVSASITQTPTLVVPSLARSSTPRTSALSGCATAVTAARRTTHAAASVVTNERPAAGRRRATGRAAGDIHRLRWW